MRKWAIPVASGRFMQLADSYMQDKNWKPETRKTKEEIVIKGRNKCSFFVKVILHKASATRISHGYRKSRPVPLKTHRWSRNKDNNKTASVSRESRIQTIKKEKPQDQQIQLQNVYS